MFKKSKWLDYLLLGLIIVYLSMFVVFVILNSSGIQKDEDFPYMLKKIIELGPAFILAFFVNEAVKTKRELAKKLSNLEKNGITDIFPDGVSDELDSEDFFNCKLIRVCVFTGIGFLQRHQEKLEKGLMRGTTVQILFSDCKTDFLLKEKEMLDTVSYECKEKEKDFENEIEEAKKILKNIKKNVLEGNGRGRIEWRQYKAEYRNKYILRYSQKDGDTKIEGYFNMTSPVRAPQHSILFYGSAWERDRDEFIEGKRNKKRGNMIFDQELHFEYLWNKYDPKLPEKIEETSSKQDSAEA